MVFTKAGLVNEAEIEAGVRTVEKEFAPDVVRIGYTFRDNWMGEPSIYFKLQVTDEAVSTPERLWKFARSVEKAIVEEARTDENGLNAYFSYRTPLEQAELRDPSWN